MDLNLKNLVPGNKEVNMDYPGMDGFVVKLNYIPQTQVRKMLKKCTTTSFNSKRKLTESLDDELFSKTFAKSAIKGWEGLTVEYIKELMVVEIEVPDETEVPFNSDNLEGLIENSSEFSTWITEVISDVSNFNKNT